MVSLISSPHFKTSQQPILSMNLPYIFPIFLVINPPKREQSLRLKREQFKEKKPKNQLLLEFSECCGVVTMCKRWEGESDTELEFQVLEFMKNSNHPEMFPSRKQLIDAGRVDLVEAIVNRGGWMSMGWDDDDDDDSNTVKIENGLVQCSDSGTEKNCKDDGYTGEVGVVSKELNEGNDVAQNISLSGNSLSAVPSSHGSLELGKEDVSGIEGILNRLERQRNLSFCINLQNNGNTNRGFNRRSGSEDVDSCHSEGNVPASLGHDEHLYSGNGPVRSYSNALSSSLKADSWRAWSVQRAGYSEKEFEADEICFRGNSNQKTPDDSVGEKIVVTTDIKGGLDLTQNLDSLVRELSEVDVKNRLHYLKLELSSAICALRSNATDLSEKAEEHVSEEDLRQISDASEFHETEIMHTQDKLRSMRAKLTILEGKMALAIIDAQKILDEKQKRIDDARLALQLLRTTCIVWPNSGSEVLLAGSFDGWSTQRKMERTSSGIFSLYLKLYPGQYEIKFIVDGVWMVDPLRPIVNHSGFDNNLLIIS
ncbi:protein PTST homolog 2, chloroplastic isoform X1 [Silene latifolia]|uniref:protein PTST homolog 2, chloroplastic isoform X1 n=1 Tax=Silene latifolia TaxID=37657 RepID=UPI003D785BBA